MNIQQYYEEQERKEQERAEQLNAEHGKAEPAKAIQREDTTVIPVIHEKASIHKETVESAKVKVHTHITAVEQNLAVPLTTETYEVKRVPIGELIDEHPSVRQEGNCTIIPVVEEVLVVQKRLKLVEEVHVVRRQITTTHKENITLKKEDVSVERIPANHTGPKE